MKQKFLVVILVSFCLSATTLSLLQAQNIVSRESVNYNLTINEIWDLNKYVWSQTHITEKGSKPDLDYDALDNWEQLDNSRLSISSDGKYFAYGKFKGTNDLKKDDSLVIQSIENGWKKSFPFKGTGFFSSDSKQYIFQQNDDLVFQEVGAEKTRYVNSVASYKTSSNNNVEWIAYQFKDPSSTIVLENLIRRKDKRIDNVLAYSFDKSGKWLACQLKQKQLLVYNLKTETERQYADVESYLFDDNGMSLILKIASNDGSKMSALKYVNLEKEEAKVIWSSKKNEYIYRYQFDNSGQQIVFTVSEPSAKNGNKSIWYYTNGMQKAVEKLSHQKIDNGLIIEGSVSFTDNDHYIQFTLKTSKEIQQAAPNAVKLDVWNYKDLILQSAQMNKKDVTTFQGVLNIESGILIQLEDKEKRLRQLHGDFAVITVERRVQSDCFWGKDFANDSVWLVSLKTDIRQLLQVNKAEWVCFSLIGNYLVYFDTQNGCHYFSYDLITGKKAKITGGIPDKELGRNTFLFGYNNPTAPVGIAGWVRDDTAILVYDNYDMWKLDLGGKKKPVCITNGYGHKNNTRFSWLERGRFSSPDLIFNSKDTVLLLGFNRTNKYSGYYSKIVGVAGDPKLLSKGPYYFQDMKDEEAFSNGMQPIQAAKSDAWIVLRQTTVEAPNYFLTNNFKSFKSLTNLEPQKSHNWLTAELHSFKRLDGTMGQGILYKPENFDAKKKYPLIIGIYGEQAGQLHQFPKSGYVIDASIFQDGFAWMVSHDYLVFLPDNLFTKGGWGPSTVSTAVGAAKYLSKLPFVDSSKLGACGHSNGGRMGYYLLTHSNCFAAMSIGSGTTDIISYGLSLSAQRPTLGASQLDRAESGGFGSPLGNLWENKDKWIDHASVLNADRVSSPLLMYQCKQDASFSQGLEMFISLRRLGKPGWLLQYDNGGHGLNSDYPQDFKDYTIRFTQYYDHYLKEAPAPKWMTGGIPYSLKGIESRLELDPVGTCAKDCKICKKWNEKYKKDPKMFEKPISEWNFK